MVSCFRRSGPLKKGGDGSVGSIYNHPSGKIYTIYIPLIVLANGGDIIYIHIYHLPIPPIFLGTKNGN